MTESTSENIRSLAQQGIAVAEIARRLNIRYQHAYKVCRDAGLLSPPSETRSCEVPVPRAKPPLKVEELLQRGFVEAGPWAVGGTRLTCADTLPKASGVYAFGIGDEVVYVGLASRSLAQRLYFYGNPGASQRTNVRLNGLIRQALETGRDVAIYYACPPNFEWKGFTISGPEGLEAGMIDAYSLPWNVKGA